MEVRQKDLPVLAKLKLLRTCQRHSQSNVSSSTVLTGLTILPWESSLRGFPVQVPGAVLTSSTESTSKCCPSLPSKSWPYNPPSEKRKEFSTSMVKTSLSYLLVQSTSPWTPVTPADLNSLITWRPSSGLVQWWCLIMHWLLKFICIQSVFKKPETWPEKSSPH